MTATPSLRANLDLPSKLEKISATKWTVEKLGAGQVPKRVCQLLQNLRHWKVKFYYVMHGGGGDKLEKNDVILCIS